VPERTPEATVDSYALDEIPWTEARKARERDPRLILPVGALEQHGPHLPLGSNIVIAQRVAVHVSRALGILRAPTFSYGVIVGRGPFTGRAGTSRKTLHRAVNGLLAEWEDQGFRHFVIITAHRVEPHIEALLMALTSKATKAVFDLYEIDVSDLLEGDPESEHAGELETSLMLHLDPESVRTEDVADFVPMGGPIRRYTHRRVPKPPRGSRGVVGYPACASAAKGARIFDRWVETVTRAVGPT
jgi:creatinine amidohydrolase